MGNNWFRWEREASIHLLFPTLEVFYQPLQKYSGVKAPTMILVFSGGLVTWCIKDMEFVEYGRKLLQEYSDPAKESKMVDDIKKSLTHLKKIEAKLEMVDLAKLIDDQLVKIHKDLYQAFLGYYTMGAIGTPLSFSAEIRLKDKGLSDDVINSLATPSEISYVVEADNYLMNTKDVEGFIEKYYWIDNNYSGTKKINADDVKKRLKNLLGHPGGSVATDRIPESKDSIASLQNDKESRRLIQLLKNYSVYKDNRKKEILIFLHYIDSVLKEISKRRKLSMDQMRASLPSEIGKIIDGKLTEKELDNRLKYSVVVWQEGKNKALILTGEEGRKWEQKTLVKASLGRIIQGRTACPGKVTGKVRVLLKAEDSDQLKSGEILVTFMTSPDFMRAIRRCSAIITNLGGVTSHAAIISRELNIPCIVGTKIATQVLKTGDMVEVDADDGIITKLN